MAAGLGILTRVSSIGVGGLLVLGAASFGAYHVANSHDYTVTIVMPQAPDLVNGNKVEVNGLDVGRVKSLAVRDGKAVVKVSIAKTYRPLHAGTTARIEWKALLGERILVILPGPSKNAPIPSGGMIEGTNDRVELDQVLAALDAPTRLKLQSLTQRLATTLHGSEADVNATLATAAPTIEALGQITASLGQDGPAIQNIVTRLRSVTQTTSARRVDVSRAVISLTQVAQALAVQDTPLRETLRQLPSTLSTARRVLGKVPGTVTAATPLLKDAQPLAKQLGPVSRDLRPVLTDLRATVTDLRPALADAASVLNGTPSLLDNANALLPGLNQTVQGVLPALQFVRPYTPELVGWLSNWASATANYDSLGNYARIWAQKGPADVNETPGTAAQVIESGLLSKHEQRLPGQLADQPWTDANGSGMR